VAEAYLRGIVAGGKVSSVAEKRGESV
jgi:hypothetical protein